MEKLEANFIPFFDYKILTKIISNRLKTTIDQVISKEQTYGVSNRSIFSNLFTIRELIHYSNTKCIQSYIVPIDQEKIFDKVDRDFLYRIMGKLGYSKTFINFIKKIYQNTESMISNNGFLSSTFPLTNEIINLNIKANKKVVGYPIPNQKQSLKLSQYADDTLCR